VNNRLKLTSKETFVLRGFVTGLSWVTWTGQRETCVQLVFLPRNERCTFWLQCRSNTARAKVLGTERNNGKLIVTEVPIFRNKWPGASGFAGCIISLSKFLSTGNDYCLKRKIFWSFY